jgi:hypothetical protein
MNLIVKTIAIVLPSSQLFARKYSFIFLILILDFSPRKRATGNSLAR